MTISFLKCSPSLIFIKARAPEALSFKLPKDVLRLNYAVIRNPKDASPIFKYFIEKLQVKVCQQIRRVHRKTMNIPVLAELGRFPAKTLYRYIND